MIDDIISLLKDLARRDLTNREMEELRQKFFILWSQGREALDTLNNAGVVTGLNADLLDGHHGEYYRDADKLDGEHGSFYRNASNINAGSLSSDRFSAYGDLVAEDRIGMESGKVAPGDHTHDGLGGGGADISFWVDGALQATEGVAYYTVPRDCAIASVYAFCKTTGTSGSTIIDIHKNGTTIFTAQSARPTIAYNDADGVVSATPDIIGLQAGDVLRLDIDEVATGASQLAVVIAIGQIDSTAVTPYQQIYFTKEGTVELETGVLRIYNRTGRKRTLYGVYLNTTSPPVGGDLIVDVNINGTSIFEAQNRPRIVSGQMSGYSTALQTFEWDANQYITVDIDQAGGTYGGDNLVVTIVYR
jgi:hypothetical protein